MTITYIGELSVGATIPLPVALTGTAQADLTAQLNAMLSMQASVGIPSTIDQLISLANQILSALNQLLALGLQPPALNAQLVAISAAVATLTLRLAPYLAFQTLIASAGVFAYAYDGPTNAAGGELTTALAGGFPSNIPTAHANALFLGCVDPVVWAAMQAIFKTSP